MWTPIESVAGGALIGLSASVLLVFAKRVAGISGIVGGLFPPKVGDVAWRTAFLGGLLLGAWLVASWVPGAIMAREAGAPRWVLVIAGLLVGVGTQIGRGCTSGHGVCGLSRLSARSFAAVVTFMGTGILAASFLRHWLWT